MSFFFLIKKYKVNIAQRHIVTLPNRYNEMNNIKPISTNLILSIWKNKLWPGRVSAIESHSAMMITPGEYDMGNFQLPIWCYGYFKGTELVGVNSGHLCTDGLLRIRGFWVDSQHRRQGIGKKLLLRTIEDAKFNNIMGTWAFPRKTSWPIFESIGFIQTSDWLKSEMSEANTYCYLTLK
jgi:GNAT superfamily N-acetyltransferase